MQVENTEVQSTETTTAPVETTQDTATQTQEAAPKAAKSFDELEAQVAKPDALSADKGSAVAANATVDQATTAIPEYKPDFKYTASGQEKELDKRLHGVIKSKEDEEWIKKVFSKADGLEQVAALRDQYKENYKNIAQQGEQILKMVDKGDYEGVFRSLGHKPSLQALVDGLKISDDELIRFAYQRASLTPEQKQYYNQAKSLESQTRDLAMQNAQYQQELQQIQVQARESELSQALSTPDIAPIATAFDQAHGQGAFWEEVRQRGIAHFALHKVDAPVAQMVQQVASRLRVYAQATTPSTQAQAIPAQAAAATPTKSAQELPVIPVVPTGGTSPARRKFKSFDEMERAASELS